MVSKKEEKTVYISDSSDPKMKELCDCYCSKYGEFISKLDDKDIKICDLCQQIKFRNLEADLFFKSPQDARLTREQERLLGKLQNKFERYLNNSVGKNLIMSKLKYGMFHSKFLNYQLYNNYNDGLGGMYDPVRGKTNSNQELMQNMNGDFNSQAYVNRVNENMMLYYMLQLDKYRLDDLKGVIDRDQSTLVQKIKRDYNKEEEGGGRPASRRLKKRPESGEKEPRFDLLDQYLTYSSGDD